MTSNRVLSSKAFAIVTKGGKEVVLAAATATQLWTRPDIAVQASVSGFKKAVEHSDKALPGGTATVIMREGQHSSAGDPRDHYTAVCVDANGKYISTEHFTKE